MPPMWLQKSSQAAMGSGAAPSVMSHEKYETACRISMAVMRKEVRCPSWALDTRPIYALTSAKNCFMNTIQDFQSSVSATRNILNQCEKSGLWQSRGGWPQWRCFPRC